MGQSVYPAPSSGITVADGNTAGWGGRGYVTLQNNQLLTSTTALGSAYGMGKACLGSDGMIYVSGASAQKFAKYNPTTNTFTALATPPNSIFQIAGTSNGKILASRCDLISSGASSGATFNLYIYDIASDSWSSSATITGTGYGHLYTDNKSRVWTSCANASYAGLKVYDVTTDSWLWQSTINNYSAWSAANFPTLWPTWIQNPTGTRAPVSFLAGPDYGIEQDSLGLNQGGRVTPRFNSGSDPEAFANLGNLIATGPAYNATYDYEAQRVIPYGNNGFMISPNHLVVEHFGAGMMTVVDIEQMQSFPRYKTFPVKTNSASYNYAYGIGGVFVPSLNKIFYGKSTSTGTTYWYSVDVVFS